MSVCFIYEIVKQLMGAGADPRGRGGGRGHRGDVAPLNLKVSFSISRKCNFMYTIIRLGDNVTYFFRLSFLIYIEKVYLFFYIQKKSSRLWCSSLILNVCALFIFRTVTLSFIYPGSAPPDR